VTAGPARGRTQPLGSASGFGGQLHEENRRHLVGAGREGSSRPALRAVTAARSDVHRAFWRIHRPSVRVRGDLNSRLRENTDGHARASDLAIDLPHRLAGRARTASGVHPDSPAAASRITSRAALPPGHPCPLNTAAPPRRECARRGLDPIPPPNREDRTMTETVDQAQAQPPRALAGVIEDATSLSFVSTSHFAGSRGGRLTSRRRCIPQSSHISTGYPIYHFREREPQGRSAG